MQLKQIAKENQLRQAQMLLTSQKILSPRTMNGYENPGGGLVNLELVAPQGSSLTHSPDRIRYHQNIYPAEQPLLEQLGPEERTPYAFSAGNSTEAPPHLAALKHAAAPMIGSGVKHGEDGGAPSYVLTFNGSFQRRSEGVETEQGDDSAPMNTTAPWRTLGDLTIRK